MQRSTQVVNIVTEVSRCTNTASLGSVICAGAAFITSLGMGPIGLLLGSTLGGFLAWISTNGRFRSLTSIIYNDLLPCERTIFLSLLATVTNVGQYTWIDFTNLLRVLTSRETFGSAIVIQIVLKVIRSAQRA